MLLHYIYFGNPTHALLARIIKTISLYKTKQGIFWVLDDDMKIIADGLVAQLSMTDDVQVTVRSGLSELEKIATEQMQNSHLPLFAPFFDTEIPTPALDENISKLYFAATQMLFGYLGVLSPKRTMRSDILEPLPREFVTGKELFALWLAYKFGGVILDAGCEAIDTWNLDHLNQNRFYVPQLDNHRTRYEYIKFPSNLKIRVLNDFELILHEIVGLLFRNIPVQYHQNITQESYENVHEIDNWLLVSPERCLIPLYALRICLLYLPFVYQELQSNKIDNICLETGEGLFAHFSAAISTSSIVQGYYENSKKHPEDMDNDLIRIGTFSGIPEFSGLLNTTLKSVRTEPFKIFLPREKILKTVSESQNKSGRILTGWRAPFSSEQYKSVLARYCLFLPIWRRFSAILSSA